VSGEGRRFNTDPTQHHIEQSSDRKNRDGPAQYGLLIAHELWARKAEMDGDVVNDWVEFLLDSREDQRHAVVTAKQGRRSEPNIVAASPRHIAFDNVSRAYKFSRIRIDNGQSIRPVGRGALNVVAFEQKLVVDSELKPQLLLAASGKKEQSMMLAH
jgi:hypothetical protein